MKKRLFQVLCLILLVLMLPLSQKISGTQILAADEGAVQIGAENPKYTFNTIDGESITTQSEGDGRTTVLVFGFTTCGRTKTTLKNIIASPLITAEDTRTIFIEVTGADRSEVADFKEIDCQDTSDKIIYCYHETMGTVEKVRNDYLQRLGGNTQSYKYPVIILIDKNNRARQFIQTGNSVGADVLKAEIDKLADPDPGNPSSGPESPIPTTPPGLGEDPDYTGRLPKRTRSLSLGRPIAERPKPPSRRSPAVVGPGMTISGCSLRKPQARHKRRPQLLQSGITEAPLHSVMMMGRQGLTAFTMRCSDTPVLIQRLAIL